MACCPSSRRADLGMKRGIALLAVAFFGLPAAAQTGQIPKPSPGLMPNPSAGKALYEKNCASCHGPELQGTDKGPPFLHRVYEPSHHGDAAFQMAARNGVRAHHWKFGDMPPVPGIRPDDVAHITAYVRMQQRKAGIH
ncbi:MAG: cytochrome c [Rhodocyclales bacterium]|nr:cytochrome c [Rhodocyclales bacterium]